MYEGRTYDYILNRMLDRIKANYPLVDTREGSMIWNALAPEAYELAIVYSDLNNLYNETFISTASREGKLQRCVEQGIDLTIFNATFGTFRGVFNVEVEIGSRWNLDLYNYTVVSFIEQDENNNYNYRLQCETAGTAPNDMTGNLTPISYTPSGLTLAEITETLIEGSNEASDDEIEEYYAAYVSNNASDGNVEQYRIWLDEYPGIGRYRIFPLWNGANTVKLSILNATNETATEELIQQAQEYFDPNVSGMGDGIAPIGAFVTVSTASERAINVSATVTLKEGYSNADSVEDALEVYLNDYAYPEGETTVIVSYIGIASAILNAEGIENVSNVLVNGATSDITLGQEEIPIVGILNITH